MNYEIMIYKEKLRVVPAGNSIISYVDDANTFQEAVRIAKQWEARDALVERAEAHMDYFVREAYRDFEHILKPEEINEIIRDAVRVRRRRLLCV